MRQLRPLLSLLACPIAATQINVTRANTEALPEPPYDCSALQGWNNAEWEALVTSAVPVDGPLLIPIHLVELHPNSRMPPTRPALEAVMQSVTVTVLDAAGAIVEGESGGEVDAEGRTTHRLWSWHPEAPLSPGDYSVKLTGPETITWGNSDDHAISAANLLSLVASCKLHRLDPEAYLAEVIRVMPYWPRERYIELAPKYWSETRARLSSTQLALEFGPLDIPSAEQAIPA